MKKQIILLSLSLILLLSAFSHPDSAAYLASLGYEFSSDYTKTVFTLPNEFDLVYNNYNQIQKEAGFDLALYKGKKCVMYTYELTNHPLGHCRANIITYLGDIIGGDISSVSLSGFMLPLE